MMWDGGGDPLATTALLAAMVSHTVDRHLGRRGTGGRRERGAVGHPPGGGIGEQLAVPFLVVPGWRVRAVGEIGEAVFRGDPASVTPRRAFNAYSEEPAKFGPLPVNELALYSE
jgi:hypothetical protein